jgi:prepilin-type N-terminal cleavage/methylation domain-containing protein
METLQSHARTTSWRTARRRSLNAGFSILEVLVAITILVIGLSALAALIAQSLSGSERARYMALATTLASEKLEDLNHWRTVDAHVVTGGSLTTDAAVGTLNYFDDIDLSNTTGQVSETTATSSGYSSVIHKATGEVIPSNNSSAPSGSGNIAFHRRWLIEPNPVVNGTTLTGIRRVTVLVTFSNQAISPPITFQMSLIRP